MTHKNTLYYLLSMGIFSISNLANASTKFSCGNCVGKVDVFLGASNMLIHPYFFTLCFFGFICSLFEMVYTCIKRKRIFLSKYYVSIILGICSCGYFVASYVDTQYKKEFAGKYQYNNNKLNFIMRDNKLINHDNNHELEVLGKYIYDSKTDNYFLKNDNYFYLVDFNKEIAYRLHKRRSEV